MKSDRIVILTLILIILSVCLSFYRSVIAEKFEAIEINEEI